MTQTTTAMSGANSKVEVSTNGTVWTDISGANTTVSVSGGEIGAGSQHTALGTEAVVTSSKKKAPVTVTVKCLYTETTSEPWNVVRGVYDSATPVLYVRWSPAGGGTGALRYNTAVGGAAAAVPLLTCTLPDLDANSEDPAMFEFSVMTPGIKQETVSS